MSRANKIMKRNSFKREIHFSIKSSPLTSKIAITDNNSGVLKMMNKNSEFQYTMLILNKDYKIHSKVKEK